MKTSLCQAATTRRHAAPHANDRRLIAQHPRRRFLSLTAGAAALPIISRTAWAQAYPARPVRVIVPFAPAAGTDIVARLMGQWLSERLGQPFVVENRPGGATNIGTEVVVRAPPDGYTLLVVDGSPSINATLFLVMVVNPSIPAKTVSEFVAYAKANPGKINMASGGIGTPSHIAGELFKMMAGVAMTHVPYRGGAPAITDLLGGQVQVFFAAIPSSIEYVRAGKLRALAVTTATRSEALPDIPTVADFAPGYEASQWYGIGAPKNTPAEVIDKLNKGINAGLSEPRIRALLTDQGGTAFTGSPADFGKLIADDTGKWGKVIRANNIKPE
jgi:tripartite-type tricarboxylate transporter receptor subunit TctC